MARNGNGPKLNRRQKHTLRVLNAQLEQKGINPNDVAALAVDFILAEARITELREVDAASRGKARAAATRSLNVALAERRRLHTALFKAPSVPAEPDDVSSERDIGAARARLEADEAWRSCLRGEIS